MWSKKKKKEMEIEMEMENNGQICRYVNERQGESKGNQKGFHSQVNPKDTKIQSYKYILWLLACVNLTSSLTCKFTGHAQTEL